MINHSGEKYGRLTLIKRVENDNSGRARKEAEIKYFGEYRRKRVCMHVKL